MTVLNSWDARVRAASHVGRLWEAAGRCLQFVNWCYGEPSSRMGDLGPLDGGAPNGAWEDAKQGWYGSAFKHPGDGTDAPAGVPIYWEQQRGGHPAGHIALSDGDGWCYTTDYAGARSVSRQRISYINSLRGDALGWTDDFGNNPIDVRIAGDSPAPTPEPPKPREIGVSSMVSFAFNKEGVGQMLNEVTGKSVGFPSMYHYQICRRAFIGKLDGPGANEGNPISPAQPDTLLQAEIDIALSYARQISLTAPAFDSVALVKSMTPAVTEIVTKVLKDVGPGASPETIAKAVSEVISPQIKALPAQTTAELAAKLAN